MTTVFNDTALHEEPLNKNKDNVIITKEEGSDIIETHRTEAQQAVVDQENKEEDKQEVVVLDGPLSEIYTRALRIVFKQNITTAGKETEPRDERIEDQQIKKALESYISSIPNIKITNEEDRLEENEKAYVYLTRSSSLKDINKVNEIIDKLRKNTDKVKGNYLMISQDTSVTNVQASLENICNDMGVKVVHYPSTLFKELF